MNDVRLKISPPWITYLNMIEALFGCNQKNIAVNYDNEQKKIVIAVNDGDMHAAIRKLLPEKKQFGNVTIAIETDGPLSNITFTSNKELFDAAFKNNPAYVESVPVDSLVISYTYVVFKNCVVQFFNDNLNDLHGNVSTLYQDIAKELFEDAGLYGVSYCTDVERALVNAPEQWP